MAKKEKSTKRFEQKIKDITKEATELGLGIFIPNWNMIRAKIRIHDHISTTNLTCKPSDITYRELEKISGKGKSTWQKWFEKEGFKEFLDESDDFQEAVDKGAVRMLKRLEELAFSEKGNSAVTAAKAYLALSTFAKQRISMEISDISSMSDQELDKEIEKLEKDFNLSSRGWRAKMKEASVTRDN